MPVPLFQRLRSITVRLFTDLSLSRADDRGVGLCCSHMLRTGEKETFMSLNAMSPNEDRENEGGCWGSCPAGMLVKTVSQLSSNRRRQQRRQIFRVYGVLLVAVVVGIGGGYLLRLAPAAAPGGLTCAECGQQMVAYHDGVLDAKLTQQVRTHLEVCDHCRQLFETDYSTESAGVTTSIALSWPRWENESRFSR